VVNRAIELVKCLEAKVASLKWELLDANKSSQASIKAVSSASNKVDELKTALATLLSN
jgi:hypothetical protein